MTVQLDPRGYEQTKAKLASLERRLAAMQAREHLDPHHREEVLRSYREMLRQYRREIKLYEITQEQQPRSS